MCGCCEMLFFRVCGVKQNLYVFSLYCNPDLDDRIFDCLLASMAAVQTEDNLMTDVPDLIWVAVVASIGNSDHSSLSAVISMARAVPNLCVSRKVFLKHQVNWNTVCGTIQHLPWRNIWHADNPVEVLNEHLSLLVGRYVPTKVIRVRNKDKPWFDDQCRHAFETYSEAKRHFSDRNRAVLMNVQSPHKWWYTLKSAAFGTCSALPPLVSESGGLVCESVQGGC